MGRTMPTDCEHGGVMDWGDFGNEGRPYDGLCPKCFTPEEIEQMNREFWAMNPHLYTANGEFIPQRSG